MNAQLASESLHPSRRHIAAGWLMLFVWLGGSGSALGYFAFKDQRVFERTQVSFFDIRARSASAEHWLKESGVVPSTSRAITVVNLVQSGCACNRYTNTHLARIKQQFGSNGIQFVDAEVPAALRWVGATPAALVFDRSGSLAYFGPYSSAAWCGSKGGLVEPVLDALRTGAAVTPKPIYAAGCFCDRQNSTDAS